MTQKSRTALKSQRQNTIFQNGKRLIKALLHGTFLDDFIDSSVNFISDEQKLNLREFNTLLQYKTGIAVLYQGALYQANKNTGPGAFVLADWNVIATGGAGGTWRGEWTSGVSYALGEYIIYLNDIYVCINANSDVVFTPANWTLKLTGNITQTALETSYSPATPGDWPVVPSEVKTALDQNRTSLVNIEYDLDFVANRGATVSLSLAIVGEATITGAESKPGQVTSAAYLGSIDGGDTFTSIADFAALQTYVASKSGPATFIYLKCIMTIPTSLEDQTVNVKYIKS